MNKRKPVSVPLNKVQGPGLLKYDLSKVPPKRRRTEHIKERGSAINNGNSIKRAETVLTDNQPCSTSSINTPDFNHPVCSTDVAGQHAELKAFSIPIQDPIRVYEMLLIGAKYFGPCNEDFTAFAIADFDENRMEILKNKIHVVQRKSVDFKGDLHWLYSCTCNPKHADYIDSLSSRLEKDFADFKEVSCKHVQVTTQLVKDIDVFWEIFPQNEDTDHSYGLKIHKSKLELSELDFGDCYVAVNQPDMLPGIVSVVSKELYCLTCQQKHCSHCKHIKFYFTKCDDEDVPDIIFKLLLLINDDHPKQNTYIYETLSTNPIGFHLDANLRKTYVELNLLKENNIYQLFPDETKQPQCDKCGSEWENTCFGQTKENVPLFCQYQIHWATVYGKKCSKCENQLLYDGGESSIINMKSFLVHHSVLRDYMYHFLLARCTLYAYYRIWSNHMKDMGMNSFEKIMTYCKFRHSWYAFLKLLHIDYDTGFQCQHCKESPDTIICDATALSFRKTFVNWEAQPTDNEINLMNGSRFKDRVIFPNKKGRQLVGRFSDGENLDEQEWEQMIKETKKSFDAALPLLELLKSQGCTICPPEHRAILKLLTTTSPACALIPNLSNNTALDDLLNLNDDVANHPRLLSEIQDNFPAIYELLKNVGTLSKCYKSIIKGIYTKSVNTFEQNQQVLENPPSSQDEETCFFPALPKERNRGKFKADVKKESKDECKKKSTRHPTLLPGVFTAFCKHGVCYGFQVMESNESPNVPFTFLRTRFKKAPKIVIYDNACHLHAYCLNRDPLFFKDTLFVVDNLHWANHTSCSRVYHAKLHPKLHGINTQMVEQNNGKLKKLKSNLSYMNHDNFMNHLKFFLWHCNESVKATL